VKPTPITAHDHVSGPSDAPLTLIQYGDFECPFCVRAFPVIEKVRERFGSKLRFVFRHVPKSGQTFEKQAAEASEFAAAQGQFWPVYAQLFLHPHQHDLEHLVAASKAVGLDPEACRKALLDRTFADRVRELSVASLRSGIVGTPMLFINGVHYEDRIEEDLLCNALEGALGST
jgi:protein-disulfide isomerase